MICVEFLVKSSIWTCELVNMRKILVGLTPKSLIGKSIFSMPNYLDYGFITYKWKVRFLLLTSLPPRYSVYNFMTYKCNHVIGYKMIFVSLYFFVALELLLFVLCFSSLFFFPFWVFFGKVECKKFLHVTMSCNNIVVITTDYFIPLFSMCCRKMGISCFFLVHLQFLRLITL